MLAGVLNWAANAFNSSTEAQVESSQGYPTQYDSLDTKLEICLWHLRVLWNVAIAAQGSQCALVVMGKDI
jgi:hypothetical protein